MKNDDQSPGRARELEHCANPTCGHRRLHHHPRAGVCMVSSASVSETGWCPCDEFETPVDLAPEPEGPRCTVMLDGHGECGAPLEKRWMEVMTCVLGHTMARPDLFEPGVEEGAWTEPEPEDALDTAFATTEKTRRGWLESVTFPTEAPHQGWAGPGNSAIFESPSDESLARAHAVADGHVSLTAAHRALDQAADVQRRNDLARARRLATHDFGVASIAEAFHQPPRLSLTDRVADIIDGWYKEDSPGPLANDVRVLAKTIVNLFAHEYAERNALEATEWE